ncbi:MAG: spondin domain-containing protein [Rhodobacteraceae bacterium]|nr:spondin domain-containing protein [Paracoccaceae bacterium]
MTLPIRAGAAALALISAALSGAAAQATTLEVTVENTAQAGGFSFTPLYVAFQNGSFDAFDPGSVASPGLEALAEVGQPATIAAERQVIAPNSQGAVLPGLAVGAPGPVDPGETASVTVDVDGSANPFFTFLAMLLPSNDTFFGVEDPLTHRLFDTAGQFVGTTVIDVTGTNLYDAGTEVNDPADGAAFVAGVDATQGTVEGGLVRKATSLAAFAGAVTPLGPLDGSQIDFLSSPDAFSIARITIREVTAPVPLPAGAVMLMGGLAALGGLGLRRRA